MIVGVIIGVIAVLLFSFIPVVGPILGGFIAGLICSGGAKRGAFAGFLAGIFASILSVALLLIIGHWFFALSPEVDEYIELAFKNINIPGWPIALILVIFVLYDGFLALIGGAIGGALRPKKEAKGDEVR